MARRRRFVGAGPRSKGTARFSPAGCFSLAACIPKSHATEDFEADLQVRWHFDGGRFTSAENEKFPAAPRHRIFVPRDRGLGPDLLIKTHAVGIPERVGLGRELEELPEICKA